MSVTPIDHLVTGLAQVCVVARDAEATMKQYVELAGIGPWAVYDFGPPDVSNVRLHGVPATFTARVAIAWSGETMWEIIQPLEGRSIYREFLDQNGEGLHHVLVKHAGHAFNQVVEAFAARGCEVAMSFEFRGSRIAYIDATRELKLIVEVIQRPASARRSAGRPTTPPAYWYPYDPGAATA